MMQKKLIAALVAVQFLVHPATGSADDSIAWMHSLEEAQAKAKAENRVLLVHFWSTTCPPCRALEKKVFPDPQFAAALDQGYVPVKININDDPALARRYRVRRIPTDVFMTAEGAEVFRTISPQDPAQYVSLLTRLHEHVQQLKKPQNEAIAAVDRHRNANQPARPQHPAPERGVPRVGNGQANTRLTVEDTNERPSVTDRGQGASRYGSETRVANATAPIAPQQQATSRYSDGSVVNNPYLNDATSAARANPRAPYGMNVDMHTANSQNSIPVVNRPQPSAPAANPGTNAPAAEPPRGPTAGQPAQFALLGYCPVTLVEGMEWKVGDRRWGAVHEGQVYLFTSQQNQQRFLANPTRYAPGFRGFDAVHFHTTGQLVPGKCDFGILYDDEYYLFADEASLNQFWQNPDVFIGTVRQARAAQRGGPLRR